LEAVRLAGNLRARPCRARLIAKAHRRVKRWKMRKIKHFHAFIAIAWRQAAH
jgi:hypothetical protein